MSLSQPNDNLGVFVILNGPTPDAITRSFWAGNTRRKKKAVTFAVMPGLLLEETEGRIVEPLLQEPVKVVATVTGMQQETSYTQPLKDCVNLTIRVERKVTNIKPTSKFAGKVTIANILTPGAHLRLSYNVKTHMGGIALNVQQCLVTSQDYWETRVADGWLIATDPPAESHDLSCNDGEQSTTAW